MDGFILDRFQIAAHCVHEKSGIKPLWMAKALGIGAMVAMMTRHWLLYGSMNLTMDLFWELFYPGIFLAIICFVPSSTGNAARNPLRYKLAAARIVFLLIMTYMWLILFIDNTIFYDWINYLIAFVGNRLGASPFWPLFAYCIATTLIWFELCFASVDSPPPREFHALSRARVAGI